MNSTLHLALAGSLDALASEFLSMHSLIAGAGSGASLAIVFAPGAHGDFRRNVLDVLDHGQPVSTFDAASVMTAGSLLGGLHRSKWANIDVDALAPRLRSVRLPKSLVDSAGLAVAADLRAIDPDRPVVALGLWALLAAPEQRLGALITGPREGLTAEIGLAVSPDVLIAVVGLSSTGPLVGIVTDDPIALELIALAFWQSRQPSRFDLPGPWEDPLVQRATELGLGITQPSQLDVKLLASSDLPRAESHAAVSQLQHALTLIGVDSPDILQDR